METVAIIQARMRSTRLPGKVLRPVLGRPLLEFQLERMRRATSVEGLCVATTVNPADDPLADFCRKYKVSLFRGSELDVLDRFREAASFMNADVIVRVTADCPLIDPAIIDRVVQFYAENATSYDYVSNVMPRTF